ncbi:MAG: alpha/beta fold hydrolase [Candidatus Omnitrophota bacterium]
MKLFFSLIVILSLLFSANMLFADTDIEKFVTVDSTKGAKINVYFYESHKDTSREKPVLLVHGFNSDGLAWQNEENNYVEKLTQNGYDVIVVDMRGNPVDTDGDHIVDTPVPGDSWGYGARDLGDDVGTALIYGIDYLNKNLPDRNYEKADVITHSTGALAVTAYSRSVGMVPYRNNIDTVIELAPPNNGSTSLVANIKEAIQIIPSVFTQSMTAYEYALEFLDNKVWIPGGRMESENLRKELMPESIFLKGIQGLGPDLRIKTYIAIGDEDWVVGDWSPVIEEREDIGYEYFIGLDHFGFCESELVISALLDKLANNEASKFFVRFKPYKKKNLLSFLSGPGIDHPDDTFDVVSFASSIDISPKELFDLYLRIGARKNKENLLKYWEALVLFEKAQEEIDAGISEEEVIVKWQDLLDEKNRVLHDSFPCASQEYLDCPDIAMLANGYYNELTKLVIEKVGEPVRIIDHTFNPSILNEQKVLIIPSGGLSGLSHSAIFRKKLSEFVRNGGSVVCFSQQYGYDFNALPGSEVGGYGWQEDASCHSRAAYIENFHQIFSSQKELYPDVKLDGYFTDYPDSTTVLLRRTKNLMPAMLIYNYGEGRVIVSSLYSGWGYANGQTSSSEIKLIQDLIRWAKTGQDLPVYKKEGRFERAIDVQKDFGRIEFILKTQDGVVLEKRLSALPIYETTIVLDEPGIYTVDYILYNADNEIIQPETEGFYFCFLQPPEGSIANPDFNFDITTDRESYISDVNAVFTIHLRNNTPRDQIVKCKARLNHHDIDFTETFIIPANEIITFDKIVSVRLTDIFTANFYSEDNRFLGRAERGIKVFEPVVETSVTAGRMQYTPGEEVLIDSGITNSSKANLDLLCILNITDSESENELYHSAKMIALAGGDIYSWQEIFKVPEDAQRDMYRLKLDVFSGSRLVGSSSATIDIPGPLVYIEDDVVSGGYSDLLTINMEKLVYAAGEQISAEVLISNKSEKINSAKLDIQILPDVDTTCLKGTIKDRDGVAIKGALVNNIYTNSEGRYELKRLKKGRHFLNISANGYDRITEEVNIIAGANSLDLILNTTRYGRLFGVLMGSIGSKLSLEPVSAAGSDACIRRTVTSCGGEFEYRHVPVGIYLLSVQPEGLLKAIEIQEGDNEILVTTEEGSFDNTEKDIINENASLNELQEVEPNNDFAAAAEIGSGASIHGRINDTGDEDYFKFTLDTASLLSISLKNTEEGLRPHIIIYDSAGRWLGSTAGFSGEGLEYLLELKSAGTYYVQLKDRYNSFSSVEEYILDIKLISGIDQHEPDNDFNNAKGVNFRQRISCTMFPKGDEDYFMFNIEEKGSLYLKMQGVPEGLRPSLKIFNSKQKLVAQKAGSSGEKIALEAEIGEPGRYYLLIKDWYSSFSSMEPYSFTAYFIDTLDEYEPNNTKEDAVLVGLTRSHYATIAVKGDGDFYRLSIPDSGRVVVSLRDIAPNIRPYIKLYKETTSNWIDSTAGFEGEDLMMEFNVEEPSNYFLQVQDRYNSESSIMRYRLYAMFIPDDEYISNNPELFHQNIEISNITNKKTINVEAPAIGEIGKFYLQAALYSLDPPINSQAVERFYVGDEDMLLEQPLLPDVEFSYQDEGLVFSAGAKACFRFRAVNHGNAGGRCEVQFKFLDIFDESRSEFLDSGSEKDIQFKFFVPEDLKEGIYEAEYIFNGEKHVISFNVLGVDIMVETTYQDNIFKVNTINRGSIDDVSLSLEVSCGNFKEIRGFVLEEREELRFNIEDTTGQDKIYYGVYFSSGKALYLGSFELDEKERPDLSIKVIKAVCGKEKYMDGDMILLEWRIVSEDAFSVRLTADLISPDAGASRVIDEDIDLNKGMNILNRKFTPDLKQQGLYRIIYKFIYDESTVVQGSIFFDVGEEIRLELCSNKKEYVEGEEIKLTARCFSSVPFSTNLKLFLDGKSLNIEYIDLDGYQEYSFIIKKCGPGRHVAYVNMLYKGNVIESAGESFTVSEPRPNHPPVLFTIGEKYVIAGQKLEFNIEAMDIDGDFLEYSAQGLPEGAGFEEERFVWTPGLGRVGEYLITFLVTDGKDAVSEIIKITVNEPVIMLPEPLAVPTSGRAPLEVTFSAETIDNKKIVTYEWDFDGKGVYDFNSAESGAAVFVYTLEGEFPARLRVTDKDGHTDVYTVSINVERNPDAPRVHMEAAPLKGIVPRKVHFLGRVVSTADICRYEWDFNGDGVYDAGSTESGEIVKTYGNPGIYKAEFKVTNCDGLSDSEIVTIEMLDPLALSAEPIVSVNSGNAPIEIDFDASLDAENEIQKYQWDFEGDGIFDFTSTISPEVSYTYHRPGLYMPILRVTDDKNISREVKKEIRFGVFSAEDIEGGNLLVESRKGKAPFTVRFFLEGEFDTKDLSYFWDFDGDAICDLVTLSPEAEFTYYNAGVYAAKVKLRDRGNVIRTCCQTIYITKGKEDNRSSFISGGSKLKEKKNVSKDKVNTVELSDRTCLILPAGILDEDDVVNIEKIEESEIFNEITIEEKGNIAPVGEYREYKFEKRRDVFEKEITISIPYLDEDEDGFVDGKDIAELTLDAYWFNEDALEWKILSDTLIFPKENLVTVKTNHFSLFGIAGIEVKGGDVTSPQNPERDSDNESSSDSGGGGGGSSGGGGSCFIATASFGTPMCEEVKILCEFRDKHLLRSNAGQQFIKLYYKFSPPIANFIRNKPAIKFLIRQHIRLLAHLITAII